MPQPAAARRNGADAPPATGARRPVADAVAIRGRGPRVRIATVPGVFRPRSDAWLLAAVVRALGAARGARVLDLFTGSGALAVCAALDGAREVTAVDVSRRATLSARATARLNGVRVRAVRGDMFDPVAGRRFDLIVANPPYLPGADAPPRRGRARAWEGGDDGRALVDRLCDEAGDHLTAGGRLLLVQSSLTGERATLRRLAAAGLAPQVLARRRGPLGPLARARAAALRARGLLGAADDEEELLVIAGTAHAPAPARDGRTARITPYPDGPYLVRGAFELTAQDGTPIAASRQTVALCRCGRSQLKPFCDGTHKLVGFRAPSGGPPGGRAPAGRPPAERDEGR